jgi:hypothetical protein
MFLRETESTDHGLCFLVLAGGCVWSMPSPFRPSPVFKAPTKNDLVAGFRHRLPQLRGPADVSVNYKLNGLVPVGSFKLTDEIRGVPCRPVTERTDGQTRWHDYTPGVGTFKPGNRRRTLAEPRRKISAFQDLRG